VPTQLTARLGGVTNDGEGGGERIETIGGGREWLKRIRGRGGEGGAAGGGWGGGGGGRLRVGEIRGGQAGSVVGAWSAVPAFEVAGSKAIVHPNRAVYRQSKGGHFDPHQHDSWDLGEAPAREEHVGGAHNHG
jgi:hypothetical protein